MGIGAAIGGIASGIGALSASGSQQDAASDASNQQMAMFQQMRSDLAPYMKTGGYANDELNSLLGLGPGGDPSKSALLNGPQMTEAQLQQTPGYQFNLKQGLESTQNSAAARGLASSGAALKGAANFATGLADSTYQNQFNNAVTNQTNTFNRLMGLTQLGQNSAAGVGAAGIQTGANIGSNIIGAGNAAAAGINGAAAGFGGAAQNYGFMNALQGMYGNQSPGSSGNPITWDNTASGYEGSPYA